MNQAEIRSAYAMAAHFGHAVANLPYETVRGLAGTPDALAAEVAKTQEGDIYAYTENQTLKTEHRTCTNKTRVTVAPDGTYTVERFVDEYSDNPRRVARVVEGGPTMGTISAEVDAAVAHLHGMQQKRAQLQSA